MNAPKVNGSPGGENQRGQSHAIKAGNSRRCVWKAGLRDLRDMAKARLLESQFPAMLSTFLEYRIYLARPSGVPARVKDTGAGCRTYPKGNLSTDGRRETTRSRGRKGCLSRAIKFPKCKRGIAYRARAPWQRSLRSSLRTGKPSTWRREAGVQGARIQRYA
jgi:hypothetical protein